MQSSLQSTNVRNHLISAGNKPSTSWHCGGGDEGRGGSLDCQGSNKTQLRAWMRLEDLILVTIP